MVGVAGCAGGRCFQAGQSEITSVAIPVCVDGDGKEGSGGDNSVLVAVGVEPVDSC